MNNKKKKKLKKILLLSAVVLAFIVMFIFLMIYLNNSKNNYTFLEKRWINNNKDKVIDLKIEQDLPIFSSEGEGIFYDYMNDFQKDTSLSFNNVTTEGESYEFATTKELKDEMIPFYSDNYVLISKYNEILGSLDDIQNKKIGVLKTDLEYVSSYLSNISNITVTSFDNIEELNKAINGKIDYMLVPMYRNMNIIINNNYVVNYHIDGLKEYYVIKTMSGKNELNSILTKFMTKWDKKKNDQFSSNIVEMYSSSKNLSEIDKETITKSDYIVGYIEDLPYSGRIGKKFTGLSHAYLNSFSELTGATYEYKPYKSLKALNKALNRKKVDITLNLNDSLNSNYTKSSKIIPGDYVILAHRKNNEVIDSLKSIEDKKVMMLANNTLTKSLKDLNTFSIKEYKNVESIIDNMNEESIIIIDKLVYDTYASTGYKNFNVRYIDENKEGYDFLMNNENKAFNDLFNFNIMINSPKKLSYSATNDTIDRINGNTLVAFIINNIIYIILLGLIITFILWKYKNRVKLQMRIKKEDKMMYIDAMTNLKNRNFLNDNIELWDSNKVYPQAVILIDLNDIREINDINGHEEGDRQIKSAANILIKTQREKTEIIRTDGNEFMIYMIGYDEKIVTSYLHKLSKEFRNLPYENGISIGYSMIEDEIKTLDDAINEAMEMVVDRKED